MNGPVGFLASTSRKFDLDRKALLPLWKPGGKFILLPVSFAVCFAPGLVPNQATRRLQRGERHVPPSRTGRRKKKKKKDKEENRQAASLNGALLLLLR